MSSLPYPLLLLIALLHPRTLALHAQNGTAVEVACRPAEIFIRTHMAPDFVSPQLIRRLDWYHDDTLVASFQQGQMEDTSRQWWVAEESLGFGHPFYTLKIKPLRPEHSGAYKCRLETDPLFSLDHSTSTVELSVMVTPVSPSQPEIRGVTNSSVTLSWSHSTARAHRPILRYAVLVRGLLDGSRFIIPALSNATSVIVDNLSPHSKYAFSVRAENIAGESAFGPETVVTTKGQPPLHPSELESHSSTDKCIRLLMKPPDQKYGDVLFYRLQLSLLNDSKIIERNITSPSSSLPPSSLSPPLSPQWIETCDLLPFSSYSLSVQTANSHGLGPPKKILVQTEQGVPSAPFPPRLRSVIGHPTVFVHWRSPNETRGVITHFSIHYRRVDSSEQWSTSVHQLPKDQRGHGFKTEISGLRPNTRYAFKVSASTEKGEGEKSGESTIPTDVNLPSSREITNVSIECAPHRVKLGWSNADNSDPDLIFTLTIRNSTNEERLNTSQEHMTLSNLSHKERYTIHLTTLQRSKINSTVLLASNQSVAHQFIINEGCLLMSSLCTTDKRCLPLTAGPSSGRFAFLFMIILILLFIVFSCFVAYLLKRKCLDLKKFMHKKQKEKNVLVEELSPLVYDTEGMEEVPVELFYGMCEDLARNNNLKYSLLFDRINDLTETDVDGGTPSEGGGDSSRDRYANITATESSRVRIQESEGGSDYINANYVDSCDSPHAYIATQAPLPSTFGHFWSMVWQERINVVVVITNLVEDGRRKCDQYWPSTTTQPQQHGNYQVSLLSQTTNAHFVHRILSLKIAKSVPPTDRRIHHIHFSSWPDHGVPSSVFPLLSALHFIADIHSTGPVLVHCSAGVGRSGSFILIDSMRKRLLNSRTLNMAAHLVHIRRQREKTVQTLEQFMFCHEVVRQMARHGITRVPANVFPRYVQFLVDESFNGKMRLQSQYDDICRCNHDPLCSPYSSKPVVLPGFHRLDEFIVTFHPRECPDLWRTVWEFGCETIVVIHPEMEGNIFWNRLDEQIDDITITYEEETRVNLTNNDEELSVALLHLSERAMDTSTWSELERIQSSRICSSSSPLLVVSSCPFSSSLPSHNLNGKKGAAESPPLSSSLSACRPFLFCALTSLACQLEQHGVVDVIQTLDAFHRQKCGALPGRHALEFLYERLLLLVNLNR